MLALEAFVCVSLWLFSEPLFSHISSHILIIYQDILHIISLFDKSLFEFVAAMDNFFCCFAVEQKCYSKRLIVWNGFS